MAQKKRGGSEMTIPGALIDSGIDVIRKKIIDAIDRPLVQLTVSEICKKSGISKQTFYSRFSSKFDIPNWFCAYHERIFLYEIGRTLSWEEGLGCLFNAYENRRHFFYFTSVQNDRDNGSETKARHRAVLKETLEQFRGIQITQDVMFLVEAFLELEVFLTGEWFRAGMNPRSDIFSRLFIDCIPAKFYKMLQLEVPPVSNNGRNLFSRYYS